MSKRDHAARGEFSDPDATPTSASLVPQLTSDHVVVPCNVRTIPRIGFGLVAAEPIAAGTIVAMFGGRATPGHVFRKLPRQRQQHSLQIGDDIYLVTEEHTDAGDLINHSCDPSCHLVGEITLAARRDIAVGDQLTYDYATSDSTPYDEFDCECGTAQCRGKITGEDWRRPELRARYEGYFAPYLERRIRRGD